MHPDTTQPEPRTRLETDRLVIRSMRLDDHPAFCAVFGDPAVMRFIGDGSTRSAEDVLERMKRMMEGERERGFALWAVELRGADPGSGAPAGTVIGDCGVIPIAHTGPEVEIGYRFSSRFWGRGYATEAAAAVLAHAFDPGGVDLDRVIAVTMPENYPSQRVLSKIGLRRVGLTERYYGQTTMLFELGREEWRAARG